MLWPGTCIQAWTRIGSQDSERFQLTSLGLAVVQPYHPERMQPSCDTLPALCYMALDSNVTTPSDIAECVAAIPSECYVQSASLYVSNYSVDREVCSGQGTRSNESTILPMSSFWELRVLKDEEQDFLFNSFDVAGWGMLEFAASVPAHCMYALVTVSEMADANVDCATASDTDLGSTMHFSASNDGCILFPFAADFLLSKYLYLRPVNPSPECSVTNVTEVVLGEVEIWFPMNRTLKTDFSQKFQANDQSSAKEGSKYLGISILVMALFSVVVYFVNS
eukprot:Gregarina_sp_Poly_1__10498@NODE_76_length_15862_cov_98_864577_g65_i0_p8_GENE_NODE_76_length_15862_cov_98_864577_g65_i0NODE_76_length_15862_cov_98_864577_g65_i0_p8_ORF_typecomplete_len279_score21_68DUF3474/PF11960_8/0_91DUF3474/PF11960_8/2e02_NODE_76_length_15862_cov_98_864577_g65_i01497815814